MKADATKDPSHRRGEEAAAVAEAAEIGAVEIEEGPPDVGEAHRLPGDLKEIERKGSRAQSGHQSPQGPLPGRHYQERPPEPPYPPPRGRGWVGPVPRSDHPRWHNSENKGIVKRAKQERFNQRRRRDRRR